MNKLAARHNNSSNLGHFHMTRSYLFALAVTLISLLVPSTSQGSPAARIIAVEPVCDLPVDCAKRDAIFFVHGLNGGLTTFTNTDPSPDFKWPEELRDHFAGLNVDVYRIDYQATITPWATKGSAVLDSIVSTIFSAMYRPPGSAEGPGLIDRKPYRSINFIAHSLGGNVVASYLHTVKSEIGHLERARHGFVVYLGVPIVGSQLANFAGFLELAYSQTSERLLQSLRNDNTFLPMLRRWQKAEAQKGAFFQCRPVKLWVAIEHKTMAGALPVDPDEVKQALPFFARHPGEPESPKDFNDYNHSRIAKPQSRDDPLYKWVVKIIQSERQRFRYWDPQQKCLCEKPFYTVRVQGGEPSLCPFSANP